MQKKVGLIIFLVLVVFLLAYYALETKRTFGRWYPPSLKNCRAGSLGWSKVETWYYFDKEWPLPEERVKELLQDPPIWRGLRFTVVEVRTESDFENMKVDRYVIARLEEGPWKGRTLPFSSEGGGCYE